MPKQITPLSDIEVKTKKPTAKEQKLFDGGGLFLFIPPLKLDDKGKPLPASKLWRFKYRFAGKEKLLSFGAYPALSLAEARQRRDDAKQLLANGVDPSTFKKEQQAEVARISEHTFEKVAREWFDKNKADWVAATSKRIIDRLEGDIFPHLGERPISEIKPVELLAVLRKIETRGVLDRASRTQAHCGAIFRYGVATGRCERDITTDLKGAIATPKYSHRAAPTEPKDVAAILRAIDAYDGSPVVKAAMQILPMVFTRPGELRHMEWTELDLDEALWQIPAGKMKMKLPHIVPLSRQAIAILKGLQPLTGHSKYVFPCHRSPLRPMSDNAINAALRRMGIEKDECCAHGFRAVARTLLHEVLDFSPDWIEAQLAHVVPDRLGAAYNRTKFIKQRTGMMQKWSDYLDGLKQGAKVIPFKQKRHSS